MATIQHQKSKTTGQPVGTLLSVALPATLGGKRVNIGISKLPEVYHPTFKSRIEAFVLLLRKQVKSGKSPKGVDYSGTLKQFANGQLTDMLLEHLGMGEMAITFNDETIHVPASVVTIPTVSVPERVSKALNVPTLGEASTAWMEAMKASSRSTGTVSAYGFRLNAVLECVGEDTPINELTYQTLEKAMWNPEVLKSWDGKSLATQQVGIKLLKQLITWFMDVYPTVFPVNYKNPANNLQPKVAAEVIDEETGKVTRKVARASEQKEAFKEEDVQKIMGQVLALQEKKPMEWFVITSFLTGARLTELTQLHKEDVTISDDDLVSIRIARTFPNQTLKNAASERTIPLGFPDKETARAFYEFSQRGTKSGSIFGFAFDANRGKYGMAAGKSWSTLVERLLGEPLGGKSHHSCRHTLLTFLKKCDVREDVSKQFAGHSNENNMTTGRYGKPYTSEELYSRLKDAGVYKHYY